MDPETIEFQKISFDEYEEYINKRFKQKNIVISSKDCKILQELLNRSPEPINIVCSEIYNSNFSVKVNQQLIAEAILNTVEKRKSRYENYLAHFSEKEEKLLIAMQKEQPVKQPTSKDFLKSTSLSNGAVNKMIKKMVDHSIIEKTENGFQLSDPLLGYFIARYR